MKLSNLNWIKRVLDLWQHTDRVREREMRVFIYSPARFRKIDQKPDEQIFIILCTHLVPFAFCSARAMCIYHTSILICFYQCLLLLLYHMKMKLKFPMRHSRTVLYIIQCIWSQNRSLLHHFHCWNMLQPIFGWKTQLLFDLCICMYNGNSLMDYLILVQCSPYFGVNSICLVVWRCSLCCNCVCRQKKTFI